MDALELSALLCSRLCHELVGPIGAINNGLEVLAEEDDAEMRDSAVELMTMSAGETIRRISYYRLAYGTSGGTGAPLALREARRAAQDYFSQGKISLDWPDRPGEAADPPKSVTKLLLNLLIVAAQALPRGGRIAANLANVGAGFELTVRAEGDRAGLSEDARRILGGSAGNEAVSHRTVQFHYTGELAAALRTEVIVDSSEINKIMLRTTTSAAG